MKDLINSTCKDDIETICQKYMTCNLRKKQFKLQIKKNIESYTSSNINIFTFTIEENRLILLVSLPKRDLNMLIYNTLFPYYNANDDMMILPDDFDYKQPNLNSYDIGYYEWFDKYSRLFPKKIATFLYIHFDTNKIKFLRKNMMYLPVSCFLDSSNTNFYNYLAVKKYINEMHKKKRVYDNTFLITYYIAIKFNKTIDKDLCIMFQKHIY